jgi:hypothetical protein
MSKENQSAPFPPQGWVTNHEAARMLGVSLQSMTCTGWKWRPWLRGHSRCVRHPVTGGRCNIYPIAQIERIIAARAEADAARAAATASSELPDGWVWRDEACRMFRVSLTTWKEWTRTGKINCGKWFAYPHRNGRRMLYPIHELKRLVEELRGADKSFPDPEKPGQYTAPDGYVRRRDACAMFGVEFITWARWEREGKITCGKRFGGGPKWYPIEEIKRMLLECGRLMPPYPDPLREGVFRVPLGGRDIHRKEALIDADALPLIANGSCHMSNGGDGSFVSYWGPQGRHIPLRRLVMGIEGRGFNVRHANRDPMDCRRENLVVRTVKQRSRNAQKMRSVRGKPCTSRFKGVHWDAWAKKWRAKIKVNGKDRPLGRFGDEIAAAAAYDEAAKLWFGEHAWLNFPDGVDAWIERAMETTREAA